MKGFKLKESKILRKILSSDNFGGEDQHPHSSEAKLESSRLNQASTESNRSFSHHHDTKKIFVGSWNVGGIAPPENLDMEDWLDMQNSSADIYVLGFQEIVPLNAANVLGPQDRKAGKKWNSLIAAALNNRRPRKLVQDNKTTEPQKIYPMKEPVCAEDEHGEDFRCIASGQLVGMFMTVWIRSDLYQHISHLSVSSVGCGIMGSLGNKGSISIRFCLHETSFCFVCSHLASGGTEVDRRQRNANATDIMSQTSFPAGLQQNLPQKILDHDRVIWLGDLNYRIYLPDSATLSLVKRRDWNALLKNDQLKMELTEGNVFKGWQEGAIEFPPTYKYYPNSEDYIAFDHSRTREKRRAPAWCDRIIWFGHGMKQTKYDRSESRLSDHRPVRAMFTADIRIVGTSR
ncbi:type IV inositol polyphosphate 5-phosphatase 9-like [Prosopis cineraria]|uniref:type IV inositol polyphosphate 5-phosphatase 9-like n=1 Tax=Prosopis cineraria TaxID=364024 RepID=UPI00240F5AEA|nr:type IV inositol polyphosphate 5-phosphatase 9-like [Prosopis cineraria]